VINPLNGKNSDNPHAPVINIAGPVAEIVAPRLPQAQPPERERLLLDFVKATQAQTDLLRRLVQRERAVAQEALAMLEHAAETRVADAYAALFPTERASGAGAKPPLTGAYTMVEDFWRTLRGEPPPTPPPPSAPGVPLGSAPVGANVPTEAVDLLNQNAAEVEAARATREAWLAEPCSFVGTVVDVTSGAPVAGVKVTAAWMDVTKFRELHVGLLSALTGGAPYAEYTAARAKAEASARIACEATTDTDGAFAFTGIPRGATVTLTFEVDGAPPLIVKEYPATTPQGTYRMMMPAGWMPTPPTPPATPTSADNDDDLPF
jgi:hypothetical protein